MVNAAPLLVALPPELMFSVLVALVLPSKVRAAARESVTFDPMLVVTPLPSVMLSLPKVTTRSVASSDCRV